MATEHTRPGVPQSAERRPRGGSTLALAAALMALLLGALLYGYTRANAPGERVAPSDTGP